MKKKLLSLAIAATLFLCGGISIVSNVNAEPVVKKTTTVVDSKKVMAKASKRRAKKRNVAKKSNKPSYLIATGTDGEICYKGCYVNIFSDYTVLTGLQTPSETSTTDVLTGFDAKTNTSYNYQYSYFEYEQPVAYSNETADLCLTYVTEVGGSPKLYCYTISGNGAQYNSNVIIDPNTNSEDIEALEGVPDQQIGAFCACCQVYRYLKSNGSVVEYVFSYNELQCVTVYNAALESRYQ